jgi:hypothetical protein
MMKFVYPLDWGLPEERSKGERLLLGADNTTLCVGHRHQSSDAAARKMTEVEEDLPAGLRLASALSEALICPRGVSWSSSRTLRLKPGCSCPQRLVTLEFPAPTSK